MPATSSAPGSKPEAVKTPKPPKVKPRKPKPQPYPTTPNATLGGHEVQRTHAAATAEVDPRSGELVGPDTQRGKQIKKARKAIKAHAKAVKQAEKAGKQLARAEAATGLRAEKYGNQTVFLPDDQHAAKSYDTYLNKQGQPKHFSDQAPPALKFISDLTGHVPYGSTAQNLLSVGASAASLLPGAAAFKGAQVAQDVARGEKALNTAAKAKEAEQIIARAKAARKAERAAARAKEASKAAKVKTTAAQFGKQAKSRLAKEEAKAAVKRKAAIYADRGVSAATSPVAAAGVAGNPDISKRIGAFAEGTGKAIVQHPLDTSKTTVRAILGAPAAVVGDVIDVATGHGGDVAKEWADYAKTVAKLGSGDPNVVERVTANKVGLVPAGTLAFGGGSLVGKVRNARGKEPLALPSLAERKYQKDVKTLSDPKASVAKKKAAADRIKANRYAQPRKVRHRGNKQEAVRADIAKQQDMGQYAREIRQGAKRRHGRKEKLPDQVARLHRQTLHGKVSEADALQFLGRHGLRADDPRTLEALAALRDNLKTSRKDIPEYEIATRDVLDALLANPKAITKASIQATLDRFAKIQRDRSIERHSMRTGKRQTTPDPLDERARLLPVARELGQPLPEEIIPASLKGTTKVKPGPKLDTRLRASAKNAQRRANTLRAQASELRKAGNERRAASLEARASKNEARAQAQLDQVDRFRRADNLERASHRELAAGKITEAEAQAMRDQAAQMRSEGLAEQAQRSQEFQANVNQRLAQEGRRDPIYFPQEDVAASGKAPNTGVRRNRTAVKEKFNTGALEAQGRVNESALTLLRRNRHGRAQLAELERQRSFIDDTFRRVDGKRFLTDAEIHQARLEGKIRPGMDAVPVQEVSAAIQRSDALSAELRARKLEIQGTHPNDPQTLYAVAPRGNIEQYAAQSKVLEKEWKAARTVMHAQSLAMLATSPQWFQWQLVATPLTTVLRHQNPAAYIRAGRMAVKAYRELPKETRVGFRAWFQSNPIDSLAIGDVAAGLDKATTSSMDKAMTAALNKTPMGGVVKGIADSAKHGGPLMGAIGKYEGALRYFNGLLELDRQSGLNLKGELRPGTRVHNFIVGVTKGVVQQKKLLDELRGKSAMEQLDYLASAEGRAAMERLANITYDNEGNWGALTRTEKKASAVGAFYGFLRMSMHTIFIGFPRHNPIKTAILANLGAQNSIELKHLLGGDPGFFSQFGQTVIHAGGHRSLLDLSRATPSGNALLQTIGQQNLNVTSLLSANPLANILATSAFGKSAFGEEPAKGTTKTDLLLKGLVGLNPITRAALKDKIGPKPTDIAQLYRAITAADPTEGPFSNASFFLADPIDSPRSQQDAVRLSKLLNTAFAYDSAERSQIPLGTPERRDMYKREKASKRAWKEIDRLMVSYGVSTPEEQAQASKQAIRRKYAEAPKKNKPKSSGDSIFGSNDAPVFGDSKNQSVFGKGQTPVFK